MTSESKILTVSYGTFSCTLEGFDNPFDTMKAIAEYFRDLAAQDRHFGAEPPPPDAAMLHRLAEREVSRLATGRAPDAKPVVTAESAAAGTPAAPRIQFNPVNRRSAPPPEEPTAVGEEAPAPEPSLTDVIPDGVAAKLARIRRSVNPAAESAAAAAFVAEADPIAPEMPGVEELAAEVPAQGADVVEDAAADPVSEADHLAEAAESEEVAFAEVAAEAEDDEAIAAVSAEAASAEFDTEDAAYAEIEPTEAFAGAPSLADATESVAARLGALISTDAPAQEDEDTDRFAAALWDQPAEAEVIDADEPDAAAFVAVEEPDGLDAAIDDVALQEAELAEAANDEDLALLAELDGIAREEADRVALQDEALPEDLTDDLSLADVALQDPLPEATSPASDEVEEVALVAEEPVDEPEPEVMAEAPAPVVDEPAPSAPKAGGRGRRVNSRVVRLHPDGTPDADYDFGATRVLAATEESEEITRLMQQAEEVMAEDENRRRQEALSRLKAAVVATEADRADIDYVAPRAEANLDPYRDDLAEAIQPEPAPEPAPEPEVKPRRKSVTIRPAEPRPGTIRPGMISPPPLVLVSEQRIDRVTPAAASAPTPGPSAAPAAAPSMAPGITPSLPEGQPMVALRTGRLSGAIGAGAALAATSLPARNIVLEKPSYGPATDAEEDEDLAEDAKEINEAGFASFAELVGARSMAEMLEAAAAYATSVENRRQFTRPQLMRRMMASAGGKPVSREDGLRSFGTLLRTGRIEKVTRGHYSLAENSPYLAEARRLT